MAKVQYGAIVNLIRGRLNDSVFSITHGVPYVKVYQPVVSQPASARRDLCQQNFKDMNQRWATLTDRQRQLWHQLASLWHLHGDGNCAYTRINCRLLNADNVDLSYIDEPPLPDVALSYILEITESANVAGTTTVAWTSPDNDFEYIQISWRRHKPNPDGINRFWTQVITVRCDDLSYAHNHGLASGRVIYYRARVLDKKGRVSPWTASLKVTTV